MVFSEHGPEIAVPERRGAIGNSDAKRRTAGRAPLNSVRTAKLRGVATKTRRGNAKVISPWRCAIDVASVKTTFSAAAPRRPAVLATVASAS